MGSHHPNFALICQGCRPHDAAEGAASTYHDQAMPRVAGASGFTGKDFN